MDRESAASAVDCAGDEVATGDLGRILHEITGKVIEFPGLDVPGPQGNKKIAEERDLLHPFKFGMDREYVRDIIAQQRQIMADNALHGIFRTAKELVQCGERSGYLECFECDVVDPGKEGARSARIAGIEEAGIVIGFKAEAICLPASGARGLCRFSEDPLEFLPCFAKFFLHFVFGHPGEPVLPTDMVVAVDAGLVPLVARQTHYRLIPAAYMGAWQEYAVHEGADAVGGDDAGAADLAQEPGSEDALDRAACVVRAEGKEECGLDIELIEEGYEIGDADARAPVSVYVDFYG